MSAESKTCLVTGATSGHGFALSKALARQGAHLVVHGRNPGKLDAVARKLELACGRRPETWLCDLSSRSGIDAAVEELLGRNEPLHVLVNNAGGVWRERVENEDGIEMTMAVNYLSMFQLTLRLLERLRDSAPARVVNIASDAHVIATLDPDDLEMRRRYQFMFAYGKSKLAILYFTRELARRLEGHRISVNAVDPGPVRSAIGQNNPGLARDLLKVVMARFFPPADQACRTAVHVATSPSLAGASGRYYRFMAEKEPRLAVDERAIVDALWSWSVERTGVDFPA